MKRNIKNALIVSLISFGTAALVGCGPRGESRTLEEVFTEARSSYQEVSMQATADTKVALQSVSDSLERLAGLKGGGDARQISRDVAEALTELSTKAGYTVRPAMTELVSQFRTVSERTDATVSIGAANLKLLTARTYQLLSSELRTTKFSL